MGMPRFQTVFTYRVVTPEEYDEALRRTPHLCPLALAGDLRPGQRLLDDAAADSARGMASVAGSRSGRTALDVLAARIEEAAASAERRIAALMMGLDTAAARPAASL